MAVPSQVLAQYQSVNDLANATASKPFQSYQGPFVAGITPEQQQGISGTNTAANEAQPYYGAATSTLGNAQAGVNPINQAATGLAAASGQQVNAQQIGQQQIDQFENPYLQQVLGSTAGLLNQNNQQQQQGALGTAISSGAFGGDRTGIAAANLEQQQNLSNANIYSGIASGAFNTALGAAQQQQGVNLSAGQANRAALGSAGAELAGIGQTAYGEGANTASEYGALGSGAQTAGLQGAQAQIGAGTLQQQTQQAQDTAEYNQFLQQQSYPFQVDEFLAGIAEGTGALSGSTTTTQQPGGFFSDRRLKHDIKKIGKTYDGQTIYSYKMHGDARTHIGLMAQDVEKKHPESVGLAAGYKTVDYGTATEAAANRGHFYSGGVVPIRAHMDEGGYAGPYGDLSSILATQENMYQPNQTRNRNIPMQQQQAHQLAVASGSPTPPPSGSSKVSQSIGLGKDFYKLGKSGYNSYENNQALGQVNSGQLPAGATDTSNIPAAATPDLPASQGLSGAASPVSVPTSGLAGGADTAAASSGAPTAGLAGTGAADAAAGAAAPVAADAAGSAAAGAGAGAAAGAAGSAAAGAAGDAAATEAAALAAEYVAADAALAVAAAKRGGRIKKRPGLDAGGVPYETAAAGDPYSGTGGQEDIPDVTNTNKLQTAGALVKQPTGLQILMKGGTQEGAESTMSSVFSNEALAAGGRAGYDDGGDVDPDALPELEVDADRPPREEQGPPAGLAGTVSRPAANDDVAPAPSQEKKARTGLGGWWDRNKTDVIPAIEGLAAMGTAPTRSLGVALAAGLGAGAQAYYPTQQAAADLQQRQIQNQMAGTQLGMLQDALRQPQGGGLTTTKAPPAPTDSGGLPAYYAKMYNPNMTPSELSKYNAAQVSGGWLKNPGLAQKVMTDYQQRVAGQQQDARLRHDNAYQVATAPSGNFALAKQLNPVAATGIAKALGFDPAVAVPPQLQQKADDAAKTYATQDVNYLSPWTGDEYKEEAGALRNTRTKKPAIGDAAATLSPEQQSQRQIELARPATYGAALPQPLRNALGPSAGTPAATQPAASVPAARPATVPATLAPAGVTRQPQMLPGVNIAAIPKLPAAPAATDQVSLENAKQTNDANRKIQNESLEDLREQVSQSARNSVLYSQLEKKLEVANPREFGPSSSSFKALAGLKTYLSGVPPEGLVNQAEVDKYLAGLGVGGSKQLLGSDQNLRQQELLLLMAHANPNIDQPLQVIKNLAAFGRAGNTYDLLAANTGIEAIRQGADPIRTPGAIEDQAHRADYIAQSLGQTGFPPARPGQHTSGPETRQYQGRTYTYDSTGPRNDPKSWKIQ